MLSFRAMKLARTLGLTTALLFCGLGPARADTNAQVVERVVRVVEQAATIVTATKNDCDLMGDKLGRLADDNAALLQDAKARDAKMTEAERDAIRQRYAARLMAATSKIMDGLRACMGNPKVGAAVRRLQP